MRNLKAPVLKAATIFDDCVNGIGNAGKRADFLLAKTSIVNAEADYSNAATNHVLFQLPPSLEENHEILLFNLSKEEVKNLYSTHMVPGGKFARQHYDKLIVSSPLRRCPFCGFGRATTLDHFLNKADYPWLAIVPINLIPACKDCNHGKGSMRALCANDQTIHPYFEDFAISRDQWLFASVTETSPVTIAYRVEVPNAWAKALRVRVERHFADFDLGARFSVEAATELGGLRLTLKALCAIAGKATVIQHLTAVASGEQENFKNSRKTALYQALSKSDWYVDGGFLLE